MNGIHDLGGMQNMGPVHYEENEPVFHEAWEGRVYALNRALGPWGKWNIDASRYGVELLPPADYLRMSYYEKWLERIIALLLQLKIVTQEEINSGHPAPGFQKLTPRLTAASAAATAIQRGNFMRPDAKAQARFRPGQRVRTQNINPAGHTRLPRYARGRQGTIIRRHGIFVFPDSNAHFLGEQPQHLYSVRFPAQELWGKSASPHDSVHLDLWDSHLERA
jgi:nitrile hydratase subunit beta